MLKKLKILFIIIIAFSFISVYAEEEQVEETNSPVEITTTEKEEAESTPQEVKEPVVTEKEKKDKYQYINKETNFEAYVYDSANLLSEEEKEKLLDDMIPLTEFGNIAFESTIDNDNTTENFAEEFYHNKFGTSSGSLFVIDMKNRVIYIFSDGYNYNYIDRTKAWIITDNVYTLAKDEKYYECASKGISQVYDILSGTRILEPMRYISNIVLSILIAFSLSFIFVLSKTKLKKASTKKVLEGCDVKYDLTDIEVISNGTRREYSPISTSSGGGSSGGSSYHSSFGGGGHSSGGGFSGGGGHSGGGGGHRF